MSHSRYGGRSRRAQGEPVADLHGGDAEDTAVLSGLLTGPERSLKQDPLFAFRLLADIALRALSTAISDPATAVQVLDTTESLLRPLVSRDLDVAGVHDDAGTVRVVMALGSLAGLTIVGPVQPCRTSRRARHGRLFRSAARCR